MEREDVEQAVKAESIKGNIFEYLKNIDKSLIIWQWKLEYHNYPSFIFVEWLQETRILKKNSQTLTATLFTTEFQSTI